MKPTPWHATLEHLRQHGRAVLPAKCAGQTAAVVASFIPLLRNSSIATYLWVARTSALLQSKGKGSEREWRRLAPA